MFAWGGSFAGGRGPGPSAKATEASDMSNSVTAKIRFISILLIGGEYPGNSLDVSARGGGVFWLGIGSNQGRKGPRVPVSGSASAAGTAKNQIQMKTATEYA